MPWIIAALFLLALSILIAVPIGMLHHNPRSTKGNSNA